VINNLGNLIEIPKKKSIKLRKKSKIKKKNPVNGRKKQGKNFCHT